MDEKGLPIRSNAAHYRVAPAPDSLDQKYRQTAFPSVDNIAQGEEIISQLNAVTDIRPRGRPVGMTVAEDGSIWLLDDVNKALLRIAKGESYRATSKPHVVNGLLTEVKDKEAANILLARCQACHGLPNDAKAMTIPTTWLRKQNSKHVIEQRLFHSPLRPMPPGEPLTDAQRSTLKRWLDNL